jgi:GNAT superfamily N-acetyltransferase
MSDPELLRLVCETNFGYLAPGNERFAAHDASFIRNRQTPRRHDANLIGLIRTREAREIEALLRRADVEYEGLGHRAWSVDALTPPEFVAQLVLEDGYKHREYLVSVLEGDLNAAPQPVEIREVLTEADWQAYQELDAMWWQQSGASDDIFGVHDAELHAEFMQNRRLKAPGVRGWLACVDGVPRAFFSSWPGENGVGMVEDLFCHAEYRRRGLATALIAHCVADARARGAGPVIISSDPADTPKHIYAAMGFRPLYVTRSYTKLIKDAP